MSTSVNSYTNQLGWWIFNHAVELTFDTESYSAYLYIHYLLIPISPIILFHFSSMMKYLSLICIWAFTVKSQRQAIVKAHTDCLYYLLNNSSFSKMRDRVQNCTQWDDQYLKLTCYYHLWWEIWKREVVKCAPNLNPQGDKNS